MPEPTEGPAYAPCPECGNTLAAMFAPNGACLVCGHGQPAVSAPRSRTTFVEEVTETLGPEVGAAVDRILDDLGMTVVRKPAERTPHRRKNQWSNAPATKPIDVACRTCGADIGERCKPLRTTRFRYVDGFHKWRRDAAKEEDRALTD